MLGQGTQYVMTLANSIIGVSVLAMPYCFQQCGIVLATLLLLASAALTRVACHLLLKAAVLTRRRSYELLAFHTFGPTGKFLVEVSIIGFLLGTCVAFFVVMGDLGPTIVSEALGLENTPGLRKFVLTALALLVALPLGLLRNVESLSGISTLSLAFYVCLVAKVAEEAGPPLMEGQWTSQLVLWRPAGALRCLPIFSMALSCQAQLFQMYEALPEPTPHRMNQVVRGAVYVCTAVYVSVGFFGYLAFWKAPTFSGNLLLSLAPSPASQAIKLGFVLSVALSFPLVVFPCRASIHSLLYRRAHGPHEMSSNHIPESRFRAITVSVILLTLLVGIYIPNIELVLGLVGSTIGTIICVVFPALMFMRATSKNTFERLGAQAVLGLGLIVLFLSTYVTLYSADKHSAAPAAPLASHVTVPPQPVSPLLAALSPEKEAIVAAIVTSALPVMPPAEQDAEKIKKQQQNKMSEDKRVEPPVPKPPEDKVDAGAIRKEEQEMAAEDPRQEQKAEGAEDNAGPVEREVDRKQEAILKRLEEQQKQQMSILRQQEDILQKLKEHHQKDIGQKSRPPGQPSAPTLEAAAAVDVPKKPSQVKAPEDVQPQKGGGAELVEVEGKKSKINHALEQAVAVDAALQAKKEEGEVENIESQQQQEDYRKEHVADPVVSLVVDNGKRSAAGEEQSQKAAVNDAPPVKEKSPVIVQETRQQQQQPPQEEQKEAPQMEVKASQNLDEKEVGQKPLLPSQKQQPVRAKRDVLSAVAQEDCRKESKSPENIASAGR